MLECITAHYEWLILYSCNNAHQDVVNSPGAVARETTAPFQMIEPTEHYQALEKLWTLVLRAMTVRQYSEPISAPYHYIHHKPRYPHPNHRMAAATTTPPPPSPSITRPEHTSQSVTL